MRISAGTSRPRRALREALVRREEDRSLVTIDLKYRLIT